LYSFPFLCSCILSPSIFSSIKNGLCCIIFTTDAKSVDPRRLHSCGKNARFRVTSASYSKAGISLLHRFEGGYPYLFVQTRMRIR
jgi:hypothetical protein